jgi:ABC-type sugar transport system permease subunit
MSALIVQVVYITAYSFSTPFFMVIYLAALQDIPQTLYEAAELDGADG